MISSSIDRDIETYKNLCGERSEFHLKNAFSSKRWDNFLVITNIVISSSASLIVPLMVVYQLDPISLAIASNIFTFLLTVVTSLKNTFNFILLNHQHSNVAEDFKNLEADFFVLMRRPRCDHDLETLELLITKFQNINSKTNLQQVRECRFFCCFR